ncbi:transposase [Streptomyces mirabilis]|uniref:transposase n=1 Tax=Streptomyces mirabilis TaxID=68239 RepID=UPI0036C8B8BB
MAPPDHSSIQDVAHTDSLVYVLTSGCAWRCLPESFGVPPTTAGRRFRAWTEAGLWRRPHRAVLDEPGAGGEPDWTSAIVDAASVRAKRGASRPDRIRSVTARRAADRTRRPRLRACHWPSRCPVRTCMTVRRSGRWSSAYPLFAPGADHDGDGPQP